LPCRPAMGKHDGGIAAVALEVEGHPQIGADDLAVKALVMHKLRRRNGLRAQAGDGRNRDLARLVRLHVVHPEVADALAVLMSNEQARAIMRERCRQAGGECESFREWQLLCLWRSDALQVNAGLPVLVDHVSELAAIRREVSAARVPLGVC